MDAITNYTKQTALQSALCFKFSALCIWTALILCMTITTFIVIF